MKQNNFIYFLEETRKRIQERAKQQEELIKSGEFEYSQVWLMTKEQYKKLPDNPTWFDMIRAGGVFQGYQWINKDEPT